jgi:hypothetical protein
VAAPHRRRRARTLVVAVVVALVGIVALGRVADARVLQQNCPGFPFCSTVTTPANQGSSTTVDVTTTDEVTTTTDEDTTETTDDEDRTDDTRSTTRTTEEKVTTTVLEVSTSLDVLVPGDGTAGAESTTTSEKPKVTSGSGGLSDNQLVVLIVSGLLVFGLSVGFLTWRYWRATQPVEVPVDPQPREPRRPAPRTHRSVFLDP